MAKRPPKPSADDAIHTAARALISSIPGIGGTASEIFSAIVLPPLERRRSEWFESIADQLEELEKRVDGFSINALSENEKFITTLMHATTTALKNHHKVKLDMLRNAVLNVAAGCKIEDSVQLIFLRLMDELTPWHLRLLKFFENPRKYGETLGVIYPTWTVGGPSIVLEHTFGEMKGRRDFYDQIARDLHNRGLLTSADLHVTMTASGMFGGRASDLGRSFLAFVTSPFGDGYDS